MKERGTETGGTLYEYYRRQSVLPTYGGFRAPADLEAHERHRRRLFTDKLHLPPRVFEGARLLEFGPDAGENSLVFALWGADCTLVEPNRKAHPAISEYFERFGLGGRLAALRADDLESYPLPDTAAEHFDVVDAEGFVYTIRPASLWIDRFRRLVRDDGFVVMFYAEAFGSLLELAWKVVQSRYRSLTGLSALDSAQVLFETKWASIPHKRTIESWTMDVLENPFVRLRHFIDPAELCTQMAGAGFRLYSSWPRYAGGLDLHWFKHEPSAEEELEQELEFIARSRLSHMLGRRHFLVDRDAAPAGELRALLEDIDALVDRLDPERVALCVRRLAALTAVISSEAVLARPEDTDRSRGTLDMLGRLLQALATGTADEIRAFCNREPAFVGSWGTPSHFAVFRKEPAE